MPVTALLSDGPPLRRQAARAALAAAAAGLVLGGFVVLGELVDRPFRYFSKEPVETLGGPGYVGWLAHLGSVVWLAGGASALLAGAVLRLERRRGAGFLLAAGALTAALVADDLFLLHETVYPALGVPEEVVYATYGVLLVTVAARWRHDVGRHDAALLALALALWAASVGADVVQETRGALPHHHLLEDGLKLVGTALWTTFLVAAAGRDLRRAVRGAPTAGA